MRLPFHNLYQLSFSFVLYYSIYKSYKRKRLKDMLVRFKKIKKYVPYISLLISFVFLLEVGITRKIYCHQTNE